VKLVFRSHCSQLISCSDNQLRRRDADQSAIADHHSCSVFDSIHRGICHVQFGDPTLLYTFPTSFFAPTIGSNHLIQPPFASMIFALCLLQANEIIS
jgi:hypothetical protein